MRHPPLLGALVLALTACAPEPTEPTPPAPTSDAAPTDAGFDALTHATLDASKPDAQVGVTSIGGHGLAFFHLGEASAQPSITTPPMTTQTGSTILVSIGRGQLADFAAPGAAPTDNKANPPFPQLGVTQKYTQWPSSGTALYALTNAKGGPGHTVTAGARTNGDEITLAAVEVHGTKIQSFVWNQPAAPPLTSKSVTTTGPATLVAFWWGDGFPDTTPQTATPNNNFVALDSALVTGSFVQCAVAAKSVPTAGTYDVTWTATPSQGAQLWLVAVQ